jgi:dTDP-4-amino-4,6-dideoxygalactose transaminase
LQTIKNVMSGEGGMITTNAAEKAVKEVITFPVHPQLSPADLETIAAEVNKL